MENYEEIYNLKKTEIVNFNNLITIEEVPDSELKHDSKKFTHACLIADFDPKKEQYTSFKVKIDEKLSCEQKLSSLLHEFGHIKHYIELGFKKINDLKKSNDFEWIKNTEIRAYKNQLEEGKELFELGYHSILSTIINSINESYKNLNLHLPYKPAIEEIFKDNIWKECNQLI